MQVEVLEREVIFGSESMSSDGEVAENAESHLETEIVFNSNHLVAEGEGGITVPSPDNYEIENTKTVKEEVGEEKKNRERC